jgi:hypothetical protein
MEAIIVGTIFIFFVLSILAFAHTKTGKVFFEEA